MNHKKLATPWLKYSIKHLIWDQFQQHEPGDQPHICIFTSRRSGGTWLTETLTMEPELLYVMQPFSRGCEDPYLLRRGVISEQLVREGRVAIHGRDDEFMNRFFTDIFEGRLKVESPWNFLHPSFNWKTSRVCAKIHNAKAWIPWFEETFNDNVQIAYHFRHPIPQSLSTMARKWIITIPFYLRDEWFVENYMTDGLLEYTEERLREGTLLEKYVLNWCVENLVPQRLFRERSNWWVSTYEEIVVNPLLMVERMMERLNLRNREGLLQQISQPSQTVSSQTKKQLRTEREQAASRHYLLRRWKDKVEKEEQKRAFNVLERFGIDSYRPGEIGPSEELLHSEESARLLREI